ncbi:MAG: hypothetical protein ACRC35_14080 [Angustibacter sp.]
MGIITGISGAFLEEIVAQRRRAEEQLREAGSHGDPSAAVDARNRLADLDDLLSRNAVEMPGGWTFGLTG